MGEQHAVVALLPEERAVVEDVERDAVRELDLLERGFLGEDLIDVWGQKRVSGQEGLSEGALNGGFELLFGRGGDTTVLLLVSGFGGLLNGASGWKWWVSILFLEHCGFGRAIYAALVTSWGLLRKEAVSSRSETGRGVVLESYPAIAGP